MREQHYFSVCPSVRRPSICMSCCLLLNHGAKFNQTGYITPPPPSTSSCKGVREQHYFSVRPSSVHLSVTLSPPKPLGGIQPNLLHHFPSWQGCATATLFLPLSVWRLSICPSRYLLNQWAEFNQTCYLTSPHGKGVGEQVHLSPCY